MIIVQCEELTYTFTYELYIRYIKMKLVSNEKNKHFQNTCNFEWYNLTTF